MMRLTVYCYLVLCYSSIGRGDIDIGRIVKIESGGNPQAVNIRTGARGLCQIMRTTWADVCKKTGRKWSWNMAFDGVKNKYIAEYYINKEIPRLIRHYKLPDSNEMRLACYNYGVGNCKKLYKKYGRGWCKHLPKETKNYILRYKELK